MRIAQHFAAKATNAAQIGHIALQRRRAKAAHGARLGIIGAHGLKNLGDDALHEAATQLLSGHQLLDYQWRAREARLEKWRLSGPRFFESVVLGGGTLINDFSFGTCQHALGSGAALWTLGTGVGSSGFLQSRRVEIAKWAPLLRDFSGLGVRGPLSQRALLEIGIAAEIVGDLALFLARDEADIQPAAPRVLFNFFCGHQAVPHGEYAALRELDALLPRLHGMGLEIVPVAMNPEDVEATRGALNRAGLQISIALPATANEFFEIAASCRFAIAVRLHAAVLASCVGVPPLLLGYRDKCLDFMASMNLERWHLSLETASSGEITARALQLCQAAPALRRQIARDAVKYRETLRAYAARMLAAH